MKSNTLTIIKKEFARFFGDRQLLFTTVIMPGLIIYFVYSLMGDGIQKMVTEGAGEVVTMQVENMPQSLAPVLSSIDNSLVVVERSFTEEDVAKLEDKETNVVLMRFPADFDNIVAAGVTSDSVPTVELYYNSTNNASMRVNMIVGTMLSNYARPFMVSQLDQASNESIGAMVWSKILPMLIIMMLFSGCDGHRPQRHCRREGARHHRHPVGHPHAA